MANYSQILSNPAWTCALTNGSTNVVVTGVNPLTSGVIAGDALIVGGQPFLIDASAAGTVTLLQPYPGATASGVAFVVEKRSFNRLSPAASATFSREAFARLQQISRYSQSIPVIAWTATPPTTPADGDTYLVATGGTGAFASKDGQIGTYSAAAGGYTWQAPTNGLSVTIDGTARRLQYNGSAWVDVATAASSVTNTPAGGIAATNVQAALNELDTEKFDKTGGTISAEVVINGLGAAPLTLKNGGTANNNVQLRFKGGNAGVDQWAIGNEISTGGTGRNFEIYDLVAGATRVKVDASGALTHNAPAAGGQVSTISAPGSNINTWMSLSTSTGAMTWGVNSDNSGYLFTSGRMAFFAGGLERMQISAAGNLLLGGNLTANAYVASPIISAQTGASGTDGYIALVTGNPSATGYLAFHHKDGTRRGYIGDASGGIISLAAEGGYAWSFTGDATFGGNLTVGGPLKLKSYTVGTVPSASASGAGAEIFVTNESGGAVTAFSDGTNWRRVTDRATIS